MKISVQWLSYFVALPPVPELARKLSMGGLAVDAIEEQGKALAGVVVAQVKESAQHPNADKLSVTKIDAGGPLLQVVCGAKNYKVGDKVPLATVGTRLPNGTEIQKAQLRGVESLGMLCSAKELGLAEDASGLFILDPALPVGQPLAEALGLNDVILELDVTPNRPDALSHLGVAREVAALTGARLKVPVIDVAEKEPGISERVKVRIEDPKGCPRFVGRVVEGVKIGPSPAWMKRRLEACGVRSINNVVDITNYVLLEYGHPLHAFDLDLLAGTEIVVRRARAGEKLTTLDGKARTLDPDDLVVCDRDTAQGLAGVMGGGTSEVSAKTTRVMLEAAWWLPSSVRRTAKHHGLHTEASHRFQRGADINGPPLALDRAAALVAELAGGTIREGRVDLYPGQAEPRKVLLRPARLAQLLGMAVPTEDIRRILESLAFKLDANQADGTTWIVPTARVDVEREEDLIEEVARIRGYESIPLTLPALTSALSPEPAEAVAVRRVRLALSSAGFDEVVNYSFVAPQELQNAGAAAGIGLKNPLSVEQSVMRTSLLPGFLQNVSRNLRRQVESVRLYELGRTYHARTGKLDEAGAATEEIDRIGGIACGRRNGRTWALPDAAVDFYDVKGAVEALLAALKITGARFAPIDSSSRQLHPRASASLWVGERAIGVLGQIHPRVARAFDVPADTLFFELELAPLVRAAHLVAQARALPRFPSVLRDIAVLVEERLSAEAV
ncbi:MAG TPA: phenylalanine--tRNA ligase subunit beta, partial [Myxococcaceae bacterium]|nr:phenylalanine--tRNA ligase subunit beta [Myxococcaceae bacterium]